MLLGAFPGFEPICPAVSDTSPDVTLLFSWLYTRSWNLYNLMYQECGGPDRGPRDVCTSTWHNGHGLSPASSSNNQELPQSAVGLPSQELLPPFGFASKSHTEQTNTRI